MALEQWLLMRRVSGGHGLWSGSGGLSRQGHPALRWQAAHFAPCPDPGGGRYLRLRLHTLHVSRGGGPATRLPAAAAQPGGLRGGPSVLEYRVEVAAGSAAVVSVRFDLALLHLDQHK